MTLYRNVSPAEATGKVKAVYDDIMTTKKIDFIPNFWQALSNNPNHLEATNKESRLEAAPTRCRQNVGAASSREKTSMDTLIEFKPPSYPNNKFIVLLLSSLTKAYFI